MNVGRPKLSSYIALRRKHIGGKLFEIGESLPLNHVSFKKLQQLEAHGIVANAGEDAGKELAARYAHAFKKRGRSD